MTAADIQTLVSTLGFPIVCCCALFWYMIKHDKQHKEEVDRLAEVINNNTLTITKLVERMDKD